MILNHFSQINNFQIHQYSWQNQNSENQKSPKGGGHKYHTFSIGNTAKIRVLILLQNLLDFGKKQIDNFVK